jgi:subtilisin family serine protease
LIQNAAPSEAVIYAQALSIVFTMLWSGIPTVSAAAISAPGYRTDQIIIQPKAGVSRVTLMTFHAAHRASVSHSFAAAGGAQVVTLPAGETVPSLIAKYQQRGLVEFAEPDYLVYADATQPNDPYFTNGTLWGLNNYGHNSGTAHADIDATEGWDVLTSASNIVVAVLDSGIRATHEDLAANMWVNPMDGGHGFNAFTGTNNSTDDGGHGTLVAGGLGAVGNNGKGVAGVTWRVQMMACKCLDSSGNGSDSTVIACIEYAQCVAVAVERHAFDAQLAAAFFSTVRRGIFVEF